MVMIITIKNMNIVMQTVIVIEATVEATSIKEER